jgi:hypothetical protein
MGLFGKFTIAFAPEGDGARTVVLRQAMAPRARRVEDVLPR